jgi:hypothetical protein
VKKSRVHPCAAIVAFVLAFVLTLSLPPTLVAFNISRVVFNKGLMTRVVTRILSDSELIQAGMAWYSEIRARERVDTGLAVPNENEPDVVQLMSFLDMDDWRSVREEIFKDEFIASWVGDGFDGVYGWLDSDDRFPQVVFDMRAPKAHADGQGGENALMLAYGALPPCREDQIEDFKRRADLALSIQALFNECPLPDPWTEEADAQFRACAGDSEGLGALLTLCTYPDPWTETGAQVFVECAQIGEKGETLYNLCQFPDPYAEDQINDYRDSLHDVLEDLPDDYNATNVAVKGGAVLLEDVEPEHFKWQLKITRLVSQLGLLIPALLLVLIFLVGGQSIKMAGYWMGVPLVLGSLLAMPIAVIHRPVITALLVSAPALVVPDYFVAEATSAVAELARTIFYPMLVQAVLILGLGVVFIVIAALARPGARVTMEEEVEEEDEDLMHRQR